MKCDICKNEIKVKEVASFRDEDSGLSNLFLKNITIECCSVCNIEVPLIPRVLVLHQTVARAIVEKPAPLVGEEIRFLRKNLRIKAQDWAKMIRTKKETLSRWENNEQAIGLQSDLVIRLAYVRAWEEKNERMYEGKIVEKLSDMPLKQTDILIDVNKIEKFAYKGVRSESEYLRDVEQASDSVMQWHILKTYEELLNDVNTLEELRAKFSDPAKPAAREQNAANSELALAA